MKSRLSLFAALTLAVSIAACDAKSAATGGNSPTGALPGMSTPVSSTPLTEARAWSAPAEAGVWELAVTTKPKPGGPTLADVDKDTNFSDDVEPEVDVAVKGGDGWEALGSLKARGHSTRESGQMSYNIKLAKDTAPWHGYTSLQLNKHPYDLTRMRNKLAFDLMAYLPELTASTTQFVHVTADGRDLGLFTMVEKMDKNYLRAHKLDATGHFYKAESFEFDRHADALIAPGAPGYDEKKFEGVLSVEGAKDPAPLFAMIDAVADPSQSGAQVLGKYFDRANLVTWLATNVLLGNQDTVNQNYYLYQAGNGPWYLLPWDYDGSLGFYDQPNEKANATKNGVSRWQEGLPNWWANKLVRRYFQTPGALAELDARVLELGNGLFSRAHLQAQLDSYKAAVGPAIAKEPDVSALPVLGGGDRSAQWAAEVARVAGTVETNAATYQRTKVRPMPFYQDDAPSDARTFEWDASTSLVGHAISYDLQVSKTPTFGAADLVATKTGLTELTMALPDLAPGTYYWRVTARDVTDPTNNWQYGFDRYTAADGTFYDGVLQRVVR